MSGLLPAGGLNEARACVEAAVAAARERLAAQGRAERCAAERLDLTERLPQTAPLRRGHFHPVTQARDRLEDVFVGMGYTVAEGPEVESAWYNFEALNIPEWHPARGEFDTIFVNLGQPEEVMLRSHTSPVQIRVMENRKPPSTSWRPAGPSGPTPPTPPTCPPSTRSKAWPSTATSPWATWPAQSTSSSGPVGREVKARLRPSYFPFTEPSAEFDISRPDGSWLELGGCGMVHPNVLRNCGSIPRSGRASPSASASTAWR